MSSAQIHEIEAWLGGQWSPEDTDQLVARIKKADTAEEAVWVRICQAFEASLRGIVTIVVSGRTFHVSSEDRELVWLMLGRDRSSVVRYVQAKGHRAPKTDADLFALASALFTLDDEED